MPIPNPREGEEQKKFHSRCMSSKVMMREYPRQDVRNAICYRQWRKKHGGSAPAQSLRDMTREEIAELEFEDRRRS